MTIFPVKIFFAYVETRARILFSLSSDPYEMSLNIDMKIIRLVNSSGCMLNLDKYSWTLLQRCNVVTPGKSSTRIPLAHRQLSKALYSDELEPHQLVFPCII